MAQGWTPRAIHEMAWGYQRACIVIAAAEVDVFSIISRGHHRAEGVANQLGANLRATTMLLDALAAIGLLEKTDGDYYVGSDVADILTPDGRMTMFAMARHLGRCLRRWAQLSTVVLSGGPAVPVPGVLSPQEEQAAFIEAMNDISAPVADGLVAELGPPVFTHLLDVGGGPGTWTAAFLRAAPGSTATLFDLPEVIPLARERLANAGLGDRVEFVGGDCLADPLPTGADLAWVSAIIHQNCPEENRQLLAKVHEALTPGATVLIRDIVMAPNRVAPPRGALFAINMLVSTRAGGTYTLEELAAWLSDAGFDGPRLARRDDGMNSVVAAQKPL